MDMHKFRDESYSLLDVAKKAVSYDENGHFIKDFIKDDKIRESLVLLLMLNGRLK